MSTLPSADLAALETVAIELASLAGREIAASLGGKLQVDYKAGDVEGAVYRDPVSEVDRRCEAMIRERLDLAFPRHGILGEEMDAKGGADEDFVWAVDPIDGTTNFVNGFPLFAACIGLLHRRRPVVGAIWCSTGHALRPGIYHAVEGGPLRFDGEIVRPRINPNIRRGLAGEPSWSDDVHGPWDVRKTGSAGIECAFVAAGLLGVARFDLPNVWDVAGGIVLLRAAGHDVRTKGPEGWSSFGSFEPTATQPDFRKWRQPMVVGEDAAAAIMIERLDSKDE